MSREFEFYRDLPKSDSYYRNMSEEERSEKIDHAKNNSVKSRKTNMDTVEYKKEKYSAKRLKVGVVTTFLATAIACTALGYGLSKGVEYMQDAYEVRQAVESYSDVVANNYHITAYGDEWYDTIDMADDILEKEDKPLALYTAYDKMDCGTYENKMKHMDEIIKRMSSVVRHEQEKYDGIKTYESFSDYLIQNGCVNEDGKPSFDIYESKMKDYIISRDMGNDMRESFVNSESVIKK